MLNVTVTITSIEIIVGRSSMKKIFETILFQRVTLGGIGGCSSLSSRSFVDSVRSRPQETFV